VQVHQEADDRLAGAAVEVARRFVGEHDRRIADEGPGDGHPLALATGERPRPVRRPPAETDGGQRLLRAGHPLLSRHPGVEQPGGHVVQRSQSFDQVELLEDEADAPAAHRGETGVAEAADVVAVDAHRSGRGPLQGADDIDQRRLARP